MKKIQLFLAFFIVMLIGCNPSDDSSDTANPNTNFIENFGASASRDFIGQVVDVNNLPIQSALVKIGNATVQTDVNGIFIINDANVFEKFAYITAKKAGYIDGSHAMVPTSGKNNVKIMMIPATPIATITSGASSEVTLSSGTTVLFDGAFETESGAAYSGSVAVSMFHLIPSNADISSLMPGMLYAQSTDGEAKVLKTFGMLQVELRGSSGEKLQIAKTHKAQIKMQIDPTQLATAPSSIPLWHFDEANGYWIEEGSATKIGNQYVGNVSHFSWWNCDTFSSTVNLTVTVLDNQENPITHAGVSVTAINANSSSYIAYTDGNGQIAEGVPLNEPMILYIKDACGNIIYQAPIGPFSTDTILAPIYIHDSPSLLSRTITGSFVKCDDATITNGYMLLTYDNQTLLSSLDDSGNYTFSTLVCNDSDIFTLQGYDMDTSQTTGKLPYTFVSPITTIGRLKACDQISQFIKYKIDDNPENYFYDGAVSGSSAISNYFEASAGVNFPYDTFGLWTGASPLTPGVYTTSTIGLKIPLYLNIPGSVESDTILFQVSRFDDFGGYVDITFSGTYTYFFIVHTISGTIHVIKGH